MKQAAVQLTRVRHHDCLREFIFLPKTIFIVCHSLCRVFFKNAQSDGE